MRYFPHQESKLETPNTGEDIIAASDEKQLLSGARKPQRGIRDLARAMLQKKRDRGGSA
jgi:NCS1 family nucleobase:cation symporter-1